jgi:hypothetical protein
MPGRDAGGYPTEDMIFAHTISGTAAPSFVPSSRPKKIPIVFDLREGKKLSRLNEKGGTLVSAAEFKENFRAFTFGAFEFFEAAAWSNVLVAGGAVLGSALPLETWWDTLAPTPAHYMDETRFFAQDLLKRSYEAFAAPPTRTSFLQQVRWASSDVDVFIYGIDDEATANAKLQQILSLVTKSLKGRLGTGAAVSYIRTPNTITIDAGTAGGRKVQVVTRLYRSAEEILNTFDVDCCCIGYEAVGGLRMTPRAQAAINSRLNLVDLSLRGAAYENRLVKYASRGFAIGVPGLERHRIDAKNLAAVKTKSSTWGVEYTGAGFSYSKWQESGGSLLRILLMEQIARAPGFFLEEPFPGRRKAEPKEDVVKAFHLLSMDTYPVSHRSNGVVSYAATGDMADLFGPSAKHQLHVSWQASSMPRLPLSMEEWSKGVYEGETERSGARESWAEASRKHAEVLAKSTAAEAAALKAEREAEQEAAVKSATEAYEKQQIDLKERLKGLEVRAAEANKKAKLAEGATAVGRARLEALEYELQCRAAENASLLEMGGGDKDRSSTCVICLSDPPTQILMPCAHLCVCEDCGEKLGAERLAKRLCPVCRAAITGITKVYAV